jgi:hypothetical protein
MWVPPDPMTSSRHHQRILLALDGRALARELPATVVRHCVHLCPRLDILLINPPRESTSILAVLLLRLEHSGVDYRMASSHGPMGEEILRYLARYPGIPAVALVDLAQLDAESRRLIELKGHQVLCLGEG